MKKLLTILTLTLTIAAQGQVVVYKNKITYTVDGYNETLKGSLVGFTVNELASATPLVLLVANPATKRYSLQELESVTTAVVTGAVGKEYTVFLQQLSYQGENGPVKDSVTLKGLNSKMNIGAQSLWRVPKVFQGSGSSIYYRSSGAKCFEDSKFTLTYDAKNTVQFNQLGYSVTMAVQMLKTQLLSQGYLPE